MLKNLKSQKMVEELIAIKAGPGRFQNVRKTIKMKMALKELISGV